MLDYDKKLTQSSTTQLKVDPFTDEMFTVAYLHALPYIIYYVIAGDGVICNSVLITNLEPIAMHDFVITNNYSILMDLLGIVGQRKY
ncbi:Carotenoid 9,10(9',10')-cleavage dioxygenase [Dendrobium catenatum]|uniref:Carotenoid 9,10(9',10')-cleavage dioxygenase n=1 Tax=Dendrobium catenatum TaxID=906689 RepID=A0A2I0X9S0_9ASPA|nr:Carotenoid 9,10(9',10')-cleavage dioxygenase [Dendrobium catenatum]